MPRQARTKSKFGIYHVMMRGINRQNIFDDDEDYNHFISFLAPFHSQKMMSAIPTNDITVQSMPGV